MNKSVAVIFLIFGCQFGWAGDECIPLSPARDKSRAYMTAGPLAKNETATLERASVVKALTTVGESYITVGEIKNPNSKVYGGAATTVAAVNVVVAVLNQQETWRNRNLLPPDAVAKAEAEGIAAAVTLGAAVKVLLPGTSVGTSLAHDLTKAAIDYKNGNKAKAENYTSAGGKVSAAIAGALIGGPLGADTAVSLFDATVAAGNSATSYAVDVYFERRNEEIMKNADQELMERYKDILERRGIDLNASYKTPIKDLR